MTEDRPSPAATVEDTVGQASVELTILMPCLNEAETLVRCIEKAADFLARSGVDGEILIADNGSDDGSQQLARSAGARVVEITDRGYGNALLGGIRAARGRYVIMGDADDSYDFSSLDVFLTQLRAGGDLVMGNRFAGGIEDGAMPRLHRFVGNPVLSFVGRLFFKSTIRDFHCGLRGFQRDRLLSLGLQTTGMEFASEVVVRSVLAGFDVREVPTTLSVDGRSRPPHLRSFRDGWRHLRFLLLFAPRWVFLGPGVGLAGAGLIGCLALFPGELRLGEVTLDLGSLVFSVAALLMGVQAVYFWLFTKVYAIEEGLLPPDPRMGRLLAKVTLEASLGAAAALLLIGLVAAVVAFVRWGEVGLGDLDVRSQTRTVLLALLGLVLSAQTAFSGLFLSVLRLGRRDRSTS